MRYKPYARPELAAWPQCVNEPKAFRGGWASAFSNPALPLRLELGCGKGEFLARLALRDSRYNYVGVDIKSEMLVVAKRTIERLYSEHSRSADNILITSYNIEQIADLFSEADAPERLYINFCNPWRKSGHAKHRLTHPRQLAVYRHFLPINAEIWFKTDDICLFNASLRYFEYCGFKVLWLSRNLHHDEPDWNLRTEHEKMFAVEGRPIYACVVRMIPMLLNFNAIKRLKNL
jgi:tRNA (guanine-N7-)-methyltransferase